MDLEIEDIKPDINYLNEFFTNIDGEDFDYLSAFNLANLIVPKNRRNDGSEQNFDYEQGYRDGYLDAFKANNRSVATCNYSVQPPPKANWLALGCRKSQKSVPLVKQAADDSQLHSNDSIRKFRFKPTVAKPSKSIIVCFKDVNVKSKDFGGKVNQFTAAQSDAISSHLNTSEKLSSSLNTPEKLKNFRQLSSENRTYVKKRLIVTRRNIVQPQPSVASVEIDTKNSDLDEYLPEESVLSSENDAIKNNCNVNLLHGMVSDNSVDTIDYFKDSATDAEVVPADENCHLDLQVSNDGTTITLNVVSAKKATSVTSFENLFAESLDAKGPPENLQNHSPVSKAEKQQHFCDDCFRPFTSAVRLKQHNQTNCPNRKVKEKNKTEELMTNTNNNAETSKQQPL